jgi:hypothetical protein
MPYVMEKIGAKALVGEKCREMVRGVWDLDEAGGFSYIETWMERKGE